MRHPPAPTSARGFLLMRAADYDGPPTYWITDPISGETLASVRVNPNRTVSASLVDGTSIDIGCPEWAVYLGRCLMLAGVHHKTLPYEIQSNRRSRIIKNTPPL